MSSIIEKKEINLENQQIHKFIPNFLVPIQFFIGEPGLGKSLFANYIYQISPETPKPPKSDDHFDF